jgi:hypothetical protein
MVESQRLAVHFENWVILRIFADKANTVNLDDQLFDVSAFTFEMRSHGAGLPIPCPVDFHAASQNCVTTKSLPAVMVAAAVPALLNRMLTVGRTPAA